MKHHLIMCAVLVLVVSDLSAAPILTFQTSGDNLQITAVEDDASASYWRMAVQVTGASRQGRIVGFYDLTGDPGSDPAYNYTRDTKCGLFGSMDAGILGQSTSPFLATPGAAVDGQTSYTYTMTAVQAHNGGTRTRTSVITINAPDAGGTLIEASNTWAFDAGNLGGLDRDVQQVTKLVLAASDDTGAGNEFAFSSQGLTTSDLSIGSPWAQAVVNPGVAQMAAGRSFLLTSIDVDDGRRAPGDTSYNYVRTGYADYGGAIGQDDLKNGASGIVKARSAAGEQMYASGASLSVNIAQVPEPTTLVLLALGGAMAIKRRR